MSMQEVTFKQLCARLLELGMSAEQIGEVETKAKEFSKTADAVYLNRRGVDRLFECTVVQCQYVDGIPRWFLQD